LTAFQKVLKEKSFKKNYEIKVTTLSVSDRISGILEILNVSESVTFDSLFTTLNTKQEVIVTFLAILELMRMQLIRSQQARQFDVIRIYAAVSRDVQEEVLKEFYDGEENETSSAGS
jgi:segregation and condensation protein A